MAAPGQVHRDACRLRGRDDLIVSDRSARLHHCGDPGVDEDLQTVGEREEGVRGGDRTGGAFGSGTFDGEFGLVDAVDLAHAHAHRGAALG